MNMKIFQFSDVSFSLYIIIVLVIWGAGTL